MSGMTRGEAQLLLAGIRVLTHTGERAPTPEQVADLLELPDSAVRLQLRQLADLGIVALVTTRLRDPCRGAGPPGGGGVARGRRPGHRR